MGNPGVEKNQEPADHVLQIMHGLVDIPEDKYLTPASTRTHTRHSLKYRHISTSSDYTSTATFLKQFVSGISWL